MVDVEVNRAAFEVALYAPACVPKKMPFFQPVASTPAPHPINTVPELFTELILFSDSISDHTRLQLSATLA